MKNNKVVNIGGYRFIDLLDRDHLRKPFLDCCEDLGLKGTILLSPNGINFSLSGSQESINGYLEFLESDDRFVGIPLKVTYTNYQPFRRMLVRLKKEIISLGIKPFVALFSNAFACPCEILSSWDISMVNSTRN